jgi:hypothetical protein
VFESEAGEGIEFAFGPVARPEVALEMNRLIHSAIIKHPQSAECIVRIKRKEKKGHSPGPASLRGSHTFHVHPRREVWTPSRETALSPV